MSDEQIFLIVGGIGLIAYLLERLEKRLLQIYRVLIDPKDIDY